MTLQKDKCLSLFHTLFFLMRNKRWRMCNYPRYWGFVFSLEGRKSNVCVWWSWWCILLLLESDTSVGLTVFLWACWLPLWLNLELAATWIILIVSLYFRKWQQLQLMVSGLRRTRRLLFRLFCVFISNYWSLLCSWRLHLAFRRRICQWKLTCWSVWLRFLLPEL